MTVKVDIVMVGQVEHFGVEFAERDLFMLREAMNHHLVHGNVMFSAAGGRVYNLTNILYVELTKE